MVRVSRKAGCILLVIALLCQFNAASSVCHAGKKALWLNTTKKTISVGKSFRLKAKGKAAKGRLKWRSSNKKIASVTAKGKVTAKKTGKVKITVQSVKKPSLKAVCTVTVKKKKTSEPAGSSKPDSSAAPAPISTSPAAATAGVSSAPQVTQEPAAPTATVSPVPADVSTLVVSTSLVEKNGMTMTAYLINKQYYGNITVCLNGKTYTKKTSGRNLLFTLATGATGGTPEVNHDGTIRVSRESTDLEYWTVEDLELQKTYYLKGDLQNTIDPSVADCGVVYVQGDVRSDVQIYTNEQ